ncbi:MAG: MATE family efflux transporter [Candidatus Adiutrix sp.]|jgi:MATE family multidrug resistance protein|nr:MATE family efflux transporter [Candidatus Adiutrix sp.]
MGGKTNLIKVIKSMNPRRRWRGNNGYAHVLRICLPLIASNISVSAMLFTDRLFLSRYSLEAIAASLPAGVAVVTVSSFFQGLVAYVSVFTAQYTGAGQPRRAAAALWQGLYLAILAGLIIALTWFPAPLIFELGGHPENIQRLEVTYYRILALPSVLNLIYFAMSSFLAGLGRTRLVMWVNLAGALVNIPLTYALVFGVVVNGFRLAPEWGIVGAGVATVFSWLLTTCIFSLLIFNRRMAKSHDLFRAWKPDLRLMRRLMAYGTPGGLQRFMDLAAFTFFAFIIGRLGELYLAANNIVFSIEAISFFPLIGGSVAISILVGQSIGRGQPEEAAQAVVSGIGISSLYAVAISLLFLLWPGLLLELFLADHYDQATRARILELGTVLLRFVAAYTIFDGLYLCCLGALSGAGDVWLPMAAMAVSVLLCLMLPIWLLFSQGWANVYSLWGCFVFYILVMTGVGVWRYRQGRWRFMRVIETRGVS